MNYFSKLDNGEESPDSIEQGVPLTRDTMDDIPWEGKCHRKYTALHLNHISV